MSSGAASSGTTGHDAVARAHTGHSAEEIRAHVKVYMMVFGALAVLTVVTVAARYLDVPVHLAIVLALLIASVKASLVALFFMHLKGEVRTIFWTLLLTAVFFIALITIPLSWYLDGPKHPEGKGPTARQLTTHGTTEH
ncbi:MAG TPA: cytochrome C oxidase subunit IV family protein [Thermoanaerobaculia bacterium]|nr:cytochrome C oxidase subunit IV family protein [Thermoanaerobaculia bacterium]